MDNNQSQGCGQTLVGKVILKLSDVELEEQYLVQPLPGKCIYTIYTIYLQKET